MAGEVTKETTCLCLKVCFCKLTVTSPCPGKADPILHLHLIPLFFLNFNSCYLGVNFLGFKRVNKYRFCFVLRT